MVDYYSEGTGDGPQTVQAESRDGRNVEGMRDGRPVEVERVREGFFFCCFFIVILIGSFGKEGLFLKGSSPF